MMPLPRLQMLLADLVLIAHAGFVVFVIGGLILIWIGWARGWGWIRNPWFRALHVGAIGVVVAESLVGFICPLTTWENQLRLMAGADPRYAGSFVQHWLHQVMFFEWPEPVFTVIYVLFFASVLLSWWCVPPRWSRAGAGGGEGQTR
jgi:hypothetical protein